MPETWDGKIQRTWDVTCGTGCRMSCCGYGSLTQAARHLREVEGWGKRGGLWVCPDCIREGKRPAAGPLPGHEEGAEDV
jgi:hypothetical protein